MCFALSEGVLGFGIEGNNVPVLLLVSKGKGSLLGEVRSASMGVEGGETCGRRR